MLCAGHLKGGKDTCVVSQPVPLPQYFSSLPSLSSGRCHPEVPCITLLHAVGHLLLPLTHIYCPGRESYLGEVTSALSSEGRGPLQVDPAPLAC